MFNLRFNSTYDVEIPQIILSTRYHKHIGNITKFTNLRTVNNLSSAQESSFDVYKEMDGELCPYWDDIQSFKYIYIPLYKEYYEISVSIDETSSTVKHVTAKSAGEWELSNKLITLEINTESDIKRDEYEIPTVFYDPEHPEASLLHRTLHDKGGNWTIGHVDATLKNIQRIFSCSNVSIYDFLTGTVAKEINCLFTFDSVKRIINVYDLMTVCDNIGGHSDGKIYRGEFSNKCPKCGNTKLIEYGNDTSIFISSENYASQITVTGDDSNVKNCFIVEGGDDLITATVVNCNPNGSNYIYNFTNDMLDEMPTELVDKIKSYTELYDTYDDEYTQITEKIYNLIDEEIKLQSSMMPDIEMQDTTAEQEAENLESGLKEVAVNNIRSISDASCDLAVKGFARVLVDFRYDVDVLNTTTSDVIEGTYRNWEGIIRVKNNSDDEDTADTQRITVKLVGNNYEEFLYQKIQKAMDRKDIALETLFKIDDINKFKAELKKYNLDSLTNFESSYTSALEILVENGVTSTTSTFYDVDLYNAMYKPYYEKLTAIQAEMIVRENEIKEVQAQLDEQMKRRNELQELLNFKNYIGDLWDIFCLYLIENQYSNSNYISDGLNNAEVIKKSMELLNVAREELYKASELQLTLSITLSDMLADANFQPYIHNVAIGNWIRVKADDVVYKLRLISIEMDYENDDNIMFTFSNVTKNKDGISDAKDIINRVQQVTSSFDYVEHQAEAADKTTDTVDKIVNSGLDATLIHIKNADNQNVTFDEHGLLCRRYDDITDDYQPEQLKIVNNTLAITDDNWESIRAAIGSIYYVDPTDGVKRSAYGVIADVLIGKLIIGEALTIANSNGTMQFDNTGALIITNGVNTLRVDPNNIEKLFTIQKTDGETTTDVLWFDNKGNGNFTGDISASNIKGGTIEGSSITGSTISGNTISGGTISGTTVSGGTVTGATITGNTISGGTISGTTISGGTISGNSIEGGSITGTFVSNGDDFKVTSTGTMEAVNATVSGDITATSFKTHNIGFNHQVIMGILHEGTTAGLIILPETGITDDEFWIYMNRYRIEMQRGGHELFRAEDGTVHTENLQCWGLKERVVSTKNYSTRSLYCYEMPSPMFGDVGHGRTDNEGFCYIDIDSIFEQTVNTHLQYYVFLQGYSDNQFTVVEKTPTYFIVKGTPNSEFDWELKAKQIDYTFERLEIVDDYNHIKQDTDYVALAQEYLANYERELMEYD